MSELEKKVLDHGFVRLVDTMPQVQMLDDDKTYSSLDKAIVDAARTSYGGKSVDIAKDKKLIKYLVEHKHETPLEMASFKFQIKAPVMVWWHINRHRMQSLNLQSGRYTKYDDEFYVPQKWRKQDMVNKQGSAGSLDVPHDQLSYMVQNHFDSSNELYKNLLDLGVAREQARIVLPAFSLYHRGISQMNLRSFSNFANLRNAPEAQEETRLYAKAMQELVEPLIPATAPYLFKNRGN